VRQLDRYESLPVAGTDGAASPFFSPDGRWIGFFADEKLKRVALDGGAPVTVTEARTPRGEHWGAADEILLTPTNTSPVWRVSAAGGKSEQLTTLREGELSHRWPHLLPDGTSVLFSIWGLSVSGTA
jgi:serine/threonine-protein kinase